jgi:hypothetical protein
MTSAYETETVHGVQRVHCQIETEWVQPEHAALLLRRWSWHVYEPEKPIFESLLERIMVLESEVQELRSRQLGYVIAEPVVFTLPEGFTTADLEACKQKILSEFERTPGTYPSDFAAKHGLDLRLVLKAFSDLEKEGEVELSSPEA